MESHTKKTLYARTKHGDPYMLEPFNVEVNTVELNMLEPYFEKYCYQK